MQFFMASAVSDFLRRIPRRSRRTMLLCLSSLRHPGFPVQFGVSARCFGKRVWPCYQRPSSLPIVAAACRASRSFVLASLRALHLDLRLRRRRYGSDRGMPGLAAAARARSGLKVVWPSGVGDRGLGSVAQLCLLGAGGQRGGDLVPGVAVEQGAGHELGEEAFGLVDEAGNERDGGQVVAEPGAAALGQRVKGVVDQVVGVVAAARAAAGGGHGCLLAVVIGPARGGVTTRMSHLGARSY